MEVKEVVLDVDWYDNGRSLLISETSFLHKLI